jgi:proline dehydrogenase
MSLLRGLLLAGSESAWLRAQATRSAVIRRSVSRFMPGERLDDALAAARTLQAQAIGTIVTCLGENVRGAAEAEAVASHYLDVLDRIHVSRLDTQISVKLTQLGLDLGVDLCRRHLVRLAAHAHKTGNTMWIDMEGTPYLDRTIELYRELRSEFANTGVCLQSYLYRTPELLDALIPLGPSIRIVKGAYREPPTLAFADKAHVDEQFYQLCLRLVAPHAPAAGAFHGIATHDARHIARIQRDLQAQLARAGARVRILISYGEYWFPWYMRRLAERPANLWFVAKNLVG